MQQASEYGSQGPRVFRFELIQALQRVAPLWCVVLNFDCRETNPQQQLVPAERMVDLYSAKQLSRSTLVAGLVNCTTFVPYLSAAFFRPLEYVLECLDAGDLYRPLAFEELQAGLPPADWAPPLHMMVHSDVGSLSRTRSTSQSSGILTPTALSHVPYWCLVHKYSEEVAKCDFNWMGKDLLAGMTTKTVSPYTLVVGINQRKDRNVPWIRPSLFTPLAAVLHMQQAGLEYPAVTKEDLVLFNMLGYKGTVSGGSLSQTTSASGIQPQHPQAGSGSTLQASHQQPPQRQQQQAPRQQQQPPRQQQQQQHSYTAADVRAAVVAAASGRAQANVPTGASAARLNYAAANLQLSQQLGAVSNATTYINLLQQAQNSQQQGIVLQTLGGVNTLGLQPADVSNVPNLVPHQGPAVQWETSVFSLFTAASVDNPLYARWWCLESSAPNAGARGPYTSEQMITSYLQGMLTDDVLVCGTVEEGTQVVPARHYFQTVGDLLQAVEAGGTYRLLGLAELSNS